MSWLIFLKQCTVEKSFKVHLFPEYIVLKFLFYQIIDISSHKAIIQKRADPKNFPLLFQLLRIPQLRVPMHDAKISKKNGRSKILPGHPFRFKITKFISKKVHAERRHEFLSIPIS